MNKSVQYQFYSLPSTLGFCILPRCTYISIMYIEHTIRAYVLYVPRACTQSKLRYVSGKMRREWIFVHAPQIYLCDSHRCGCKHTHTHTRDAICAHEGICIYALTGTPNVDIYNIQMRECASYTKTRRIHRFKWQATKHRTYSRITHILSGRYW